MNKKLIMIIAIVLVIAIAAVVVFVFVLGGEEKEVPIVLTEYSPGEHFIANIADAPTRYVKATIVLIVNTDDAEMTEFLTKNNTLIRDTIYTVLRRQDEESLRALDWSPIKEAIISEVNSVLEIDNIIDVWFNDFVVS